MQLFLLTITFFASTFYIINLTKKWSIKFGGNIHIILNLQLENMC